MFMMKMNLLLVTLNFLKDLGKLDSNSLQRLLESLLVNSFINGVHVIIYTSQ